jgi:hypothetical protein
MLMFVGVLTFAQAQDIDVDVRVKINAEAVEDMTNMLNQVMYYPIRDTNGVVVVESAIDKFSRLSVSHCLTRFWAGQRRAYLQKQVAAADPVSNQ